MAATVSVQFRLAAAHEEVQLQREMRTRLARRMFRRSLNAYEVCTYRVSGGIAIEKGVLRIIANFFNPLDAAELHLAASLPAYCPRELSKLVAVAKNGSSSSSLGRFCFLPGTLDTQSFVAVKVLVGSCAVAGDNNDLEVKTIGSLHRSTSIGELRAHFLRNGLFLPPIRKDHRHPGDGCALKVLPFFDENARGVALQESLSRRQGLSLHCACHWVRKIASAKSKHTNTGSQDSNNSKRRRLDNSRGMNGTTSAAASRPSASTTPSERDIRNEHGEAAAAQDGSPRGRTSEDNDIASTRSETDELTTPEEEEENLADLYNTPCAPADMEKLTIGQLWQFFSKVAAQRDRNEAHSTSNITTTTSSSTTSSLQAEQGLQQRTIWLRLVNTFAPTPCPKCRLPCVSSVDGGRMLHNHASAVKCAGISPARMNGQGSVSSSSRSSSSTMSGVEHSPSTSVAASASRGTRTKWTSTVIASDPLGNKVHEGLQIVHLHGVYQCNRCWQKTLSVKVRSHMEDRRGSAKMLNALKNT
ncbi:unnamed protein product [Amoebophrya sp. A25]|nr:unnamed protein product [Amoebophrya sp. A25]|eukprot:GSA25T00002232001.1